MNIKVFTKNEINNTHGYLIINNNNAVLIDTACNAEEIIKYCVENSILITDVFLTHSHFDHLLGLNEIIEKFNDIKVHIGKDDFERIFSSRKNFSKMRKTPYEIKYRSNCFPIELSDQIISTSIGDVKCKLMGGHSKGTTFFTFENNIFIGDTLFFDKLGFHNILIPGCNVKKFKQSIVWLTKNTNGLKIYPGHHKEGFVIEDVLNNKDHQVFKEKIIKYK